MVPSFPDVAVRIESLHKTFRQEGVAVHALTDLTLDVPAGAAYGVLGANGSGKTTLLRLLCGAMRPTSGRIYVLGHKVEESAGLPLPHVVAILPNHDGLSLRRSIAEALLQESDPQMDSAREDRRPQVENWLHTLGLWERRDQPLRCLSPATRRAIHMAGALIADPPLLMIDEPTLGLDGRLERIAESALRDYSGQKGKTLILTTCHVHVIKALCDHMVVLDRGCLMEQGAVEQVLDRLPGHRCFIRVKGHLGREWAGLFEGMKIENVAHSEAVLSGIVRDQAASYGLVQRVFEVGLPLLSVGPMEPDLDMLIHAAGMKGGEASAF